jgi:hypothetical protein
MHANPDLINADVTTGRHFYLLHFLGADLYILINCDYLARISDTSKSHLLFFELRVLFFASRADDIFLV